MIRMENLTKSFGHRLLFEEASFKINSHERVGLVGRNGHGKTTLFQIITGHEPYDTGTITIPKHYRIGYVRQDLEFAQDTVLKEGMRGLSEQERDYHWKVEKILSGLGFSVKDMNRHPNEFSGGYQVRLNLAKVLVSEPDLLLLDEPTNYLDITSIRWIERFLINWSHELMLITHDRGFMDKIVTHVLGIHRKKYGKYRETRKSFTPRLLRKRKYMKKPVSMMRGGRKKSTSLSAASGPRQGLQTWCSPGSRPWKKWRSGKSWKNLKGLSFLFAAIRFTENMY